MIPAVRREGVVALSSILVFTAALSLLTYAPADGVSAQDPPAGQEKVTKEDFNGDGVADTLTCLADGGSGSGGDFATLTDGKTGKAYSYNTFGSYGQFLRLIPYNNALLTPKYQGFREALEGALFPGIPAGRIESSLAWLVDAYSRPPKEIDGPGKALFSQKIRFQPVWTEGEAVLPGSYYCSTSVEALFRRFPVVGENNPSYDAEHRQGWLVYYASNHGSLELVHDSEGFRVFKSAHGVVVSRDGRHCWVFVNDGALTDGPQKLRWPSVRKVLVSEELVFIGHAGAEEGLFVVDPRDGVAGRLRRDLFPGAGGDFDVRDGRLVVRTGAGSKSLRLDKIKEGLK
jgi:hypothetical protein